MKASRYLVGLVSVLLVISVQIGCAPPAPVEVKPLAPIKVGMLTSLSGSLANIGQGLIDGFNLYLDEVGHEIKGRSIELIVEDDAGSPAVGLTKIAKLVEKDQVQILTGIVQTGIGYAVRDYVHQAQVPLVIANAGGIGLTAEKRSPYIFRTGHGSNDQENVTMPDYMRNELGLSKIILIYSDIGAGIEKVGTIKTGFVALGGSIVQEDIKVPFGTSDFGPYLSRINPASADAVVAWFSGADAIGFVKQFDEFGLKARIRLLGSDGLVDEGTLAQQGESALGINLTEVYCRALDNPENKAFLKNFKAKYGSLPDLWDDMGYTAAKAIGIAIEGVGGNVEDKAKFLETLRGVQFNDPRGPISFDKYQNVVMNTYMMRIVKVGGEVQMIPIYTYPNRHQSYSGD